MTPRTSTCHIRYRAVPLTTEPEIGKAYAIEGEKGHFTFEKVTVSQDGRVSWHFVSSQGQFRAFRPEKVRDLVEIKRRKRRKEV